MAGSQEMTTFYAKRIIGDNSAQDWAGALLHSGDGRANEASGNTWLFADDRGTTASPYGIKHNQVNDVIEYIGAGTTRTKIYLGESKVEATTFAGNASSASVWQTARDFTIKDADNTNAGTATSVQGNENEILHLPSTIKATITGSASENVLKSGDTMSGNLIVQRTGEVYVKSENTTSSVAAYLIAEPDGPHGVYSNGYWNGSAYTANGKWMIYRNTSGNVIVNGDCTGNAATATEGKYLMNRGGSTVSIGDSSWGLQHTPSGQTNRAIVFSQKWTQSGLTYTPSGGSATAISDTADYRMWLSSGNASNTLQVNMQLDGVIYALGGFIGNATTATALTSNAGSTTQPIYFTGGKPSATSYSLSATINAGDSAYVACYSGANAISSAKAATGMIMPAHYYHNLYNNNPTTGTTVYVHYYNTSTTSTNSFANLRVKTSSSYKTLAFGGDGNLTWEGHIKATAGYLCSTANGNTVTIGSANTSWTHFQNSESRPFYFSHALWANGDIGYYNTKSYISSNGFHAPKNGGIYWDPYVESSSDASDVSSIYQIASGVAGGTELRINQQNDSTDVINICAPYYIYMNSKKAFSIYDSWLRINEDKGFSSGVYFGTSTVRTDGEFWSDQIRLVDNWVGFYNSVQGATRYGYIQANADRMYFRKENGVSSYAFDFNGILYNSERVIINYKSGTWVNSLTNSAITLTDVASSYGGWICGPTKDGRIAISTYQGNDNYIYLGYGERGRTTNSFAQSIKWDGANNVLYTNRVDMTWLRITNDSSNNADDATVYIQCQTANDWALKIVKGGKDYGIRVDSLDQGNAIWTNGYVSARCIWANQGSNGERDVGVSSSTSGSLYLYAHTTGKGLYSGSGYKTGTVIGITSSAVTFYGALSGNADTATTATKANYLNGTSMWTDGSNGPTWYVGTSSTARIWFYGDTGAIKTSNRIWINCNSDATTGTADSGDLIVGPKDGANLCIDGNEILARNNGAKAKLYIQDEAGDTEIGGAVYARGSLYPNTNNGVSLGSSTLEWSSTNSRVVYARHYDASSNYTGDRNMYYGYNRGNAHYFYKCDGSNRVHLATIDGSLSLPNGSVYARIDSGEAHCEARNAAQRVYLYSHSNGSAGIYRVCANGTAHSIIQVNNNSISSNFYGRIYAVKNEGYSVQQCIVCKATSDKAYFYGIVTIPFYCASSNCTITNATQYGVVYFYGQTSGITLTLSNSVVCDQAGGNHINIKIPASGLTNANALMWIRISFDYKFT